ncbi:restriction endonuclease [Aliikangiella maris]|uniref:Uncharacterized protein n=2 Tax=Aliikangiella maris TaxID=3162458 RepID=A0ABV2BX61_9GAMM
MTKAWMVRAGRGGLFIDDFINNNLVAIGWNLLGELSQLQADAQLKAAYIQYYGNEKPNKTANALSMLRRFYHEIQPGDWLLTYSPKQRLYHIGEDLNQYEYRHCDTGLYANIRRVNWLGTVKRDCLSANSRSSLGSVLSLFTVKEKVRLEIESQLARDVSV